MEITNMDIVLLALVMYFIVNSSKYLLLLLFQGDSNVRERIIILIR